MIESCPVAASVRPSDVDLDLDQRLAPLPDHRAPDNGLLRTETNQRRVAGHTMRAKGGYVADGLNQIGLALPVEPDHGGDPGSQRQLGLCIAAEVDDRQMPQVHDRVT